MKMIPLYKLITIIVMSTFLFGQTWPINNYDQISSDLFFY